MASGSQVWRMYWADLAVAAMRSRMVRRSGEVRRLSKRVKACRFR